MPLPLRLVAFERYMLVDDRPRHPMTFTIRLKFSGALDTAALATAIRTAVRRHPLLRARLSGDTERTLTFDNSPDEYPYVDIADHGTPLRFPGSERIDLRRENGLRVWVRHGEGRVEMRFQFHHSATDGLGAYRFVEDVLCAYDMAVHPLAGRSALRPIEHQRLRNRARFGLSWWRVILRLPQEVWGVVVGVLLFFARRPAATRSPHCPHVDDDSQLELLDYPAHTFTTEETRQICSAARAGGGTLNDLMLRDWFVALDDWNRRLDPAMRKEMIRIVVPMDLRVAGDELMPAADVVAMINVDRRLGHKTNLRGLLRGIHIEMRFLKVFRLSLAFIRACGITGLVPGGQALLAQARRCYATSVLSNLGKLFTRAQMAREDGRLLVGDMVLEGVESAPPVRPFTHTSFSTLSYAGKLTVVMNYDRYHFTAGDAQALLDCVVQQMRRSASLEAAPAASVALPA